MLIISLVYRRGQILLFYKRFHVPMKHLILQINFLVQWKLTLCLEKKYSLPYIYEHSAYKIFLLEYALKGVYEYVVVNCQYALESLLTVWHKILVDRRGQNSNPMCRFTGIELSTDSVHQSMPGL